MFTFNFNFPKDSLSLDELSNYSPWLEKILSSTSSKPIHRKSADSLLREYGIDKWGTLLKQLKMTQVPEVSIADSLCLGPDRVSAFFLNNKYYTAQLYDIHAAYSAFVMQVMAHYSKPNDHIVDLGAGYGSLSLKMSRIPTFSQNTFSLLEFTQPGVDCINLLSSRSQTITNIGLCDLNNLDISAYDLPAGSLFFTSWVLACLPSYLSSTIQKIIDLKPKYVIHFEPCFEFYNLAYPLSSFLWRKYTFLNDYNRTILGALTTFEAESKITFDCRVPNIFGCNPLCPISLLVWKPL